MSFFFLYIRHKNSARGDEGRSLGHLLWDPALPSNRLELLSNGGDGPPKENRCNPRRKEVGQDPLSPQPRLTPSKTWLKQCFNGILDVKPAYPLFTCSETVRKFPLFLTADTIKVVSSVLPCWYLKRISRPKMSWSNLVPSRDTPSSYKMVHPNRSISIW